MKRISAASTTYFLFTVPALVFYSLIWGYNFIRGFLYSLTDWTGLGRTYNYIGLQNYINVLKTNRLWSALGTTFFYSILLVVLVVFFSLVLSLVLNRGYRLKSLYRAIFFFPAMISLVTIALIFDQLYFRAFPLVGEALGIPFLSRNLVANPATALYSILIVHVWQGCAIPTVLFVAALQSVPEELKESAALDGANAFQRFVHIVFPYLIPVFSVIFVLTLKAGITVFDYVLVLTDGGPAGATETVALLIYEHGFGAFKFGYANAEAFLLFVIIAVISVVQIRLLNRKGAA